MVKLLFCFVCLGVFVVRHFPTKQFNYFDLEVYYADSISLSKLHPEDVFFQDRFITCGFMMSNFFTICSWQDHSSSLSNPSSLEMSRIKITAPFSYNWIVKVLTIEIPRECSEYKYTIVGQWSDFSVI